MNFIDVNQSTTIRSLQNQTTPCGEEYCFSALGNALLYFLDSQFCKILIGTVWSLLVLFGILGNKVKEIK